MTEGTNSARLIDLGDNFGNIVVKANGAQVRIGADGRLHGLPAPSNDALLVSPAASAKGKTAPEIGDEMADRTIYAGVSPDTLKLMFARPRDESGTYNFNEAAKHAQIIGDGFRVPTKGELNVLYENRNRGRLKGTFSETESNPAWWYWSSTPCLPDVAWAQRFSDGNQNIYGSFLASCLRLVR